MENNSNGVNMVRTLVNVEIQGFLIRIPDCLHGENKTNSVYDGEFVINYILLIVIMRNDCDA